MYGWFVSRMRTYGNLSQRFRRAYTAVTNQQYERVISQIDASLVDEEEKERLRQWAADVRQREYTDKVPVRASESGE